MTKQREDELNGFNLNNGFKHIISNVNSTDEFSSAHYTHNFDSNKVGLEKIWKIWYVKS